MAVPGDDGELPSGRLFSYNQQQLVTQSTYQAGNTLDQIIVPEHSSHFVRDVTVHSLLLRPISSSLSPWSSTTSSADRLIHISRHKTD